MAIAHMTHRVRWAKKDPPQKKNACTYSWTLEQLKHEHYYQQIFVANRLQFTSFKLLLINHNILRNKWSSLETRSNSNHYIAGIKLYCHTAIVYCIPSNHPYNVLTSLITYTWWLPSYQCFFFAFIKIWNSDRWLNVPRYSPSYHPIMSFQISLSFKNKNITSNSLKVLKPSNQFQNHIDFKI